MKKVKHAPGRERFSGNRTNPSDFKDCIDNLTQTMKFVGAKCDPL